MRIGKISLYITLFLSCLFLGLDFSMAQKPDGAYFTQQKLGDSQFSPQRFWSVGGGIFDGIPYQDDASFAKFVNPDYPLNDKKYQPKLISVSGDYINQAGRQSKIRADIKPSLDAMAKDFYKKFNTKLVVVSAFRDYTYQKRLWDLGRCDDGPFCALPGYSEHQLGMALDLFDPSSADEFYSNPTYVGYIDWLKANAHTYGWSLSYQYGFERDGYNPEPWHWRYLGVDLATRLHELDWNYTRLLGFYREVGKY